MAWMPTDDIGPQGYQTFDIVDDSKERLAALTAQVVEQYAHLDKTDLMHSGYKVCEVGLETGFRFPLPERSLKAQMDRKIRWLPDAYPFSIGQAVNQKFIDAIEAIEPGVHQYLPFEILQPDGSLYHTQYWLLNICNRVDSIDFEHSENLHAFYWPDSDIVMSYGFNTFRANEQRPKFVIAKDRVAGMAFWFDPKLRLPGLIVSDALKQKLEAVGATGWNFYDYAEEEILDKSTITPEFRNSRARYVYEI
jgi:hypothetical protein